MADLNHTLRDESGTAGVAGELEARLLTTLRETQSQTSNNPITLTIRRPDAEMLAGLDGSTSYGWLLIKVLWVAPRWRYQGLGRRLVCRAMAKARDSGCHSAWLDTSSVTAADFYRRMGFRPFGELKNGPDMAPPDHCRLFMKRSL